MSSTVTTAAATTTTTTVTTHTHTDYTSTRVEICRLFTNGVQRPYRDTRSLYSMFLLILTQGDRPPSVSVCRR